jgi:hypothetical protein
MLKTNSTQEVGMKNHPMRFALLLCVMDDIESPTLNDASELEDGQPNGVILCTA